MEKIYALHVVALTANICYLVAVLAGGILLLGVEENIFLNLLGGGVLACTGQLLKEVKFFWGECVWNY